MIDHADNVFDLNAVLHPGTVFDHPRDAYHAFQVFGVFLIPFAGLGVKVLTRGRIWWSVATLLLFIFPGTRGHCLVIPRAHAADITEIAPEDLAACAAAAQDLSKRALAKLGAEGVNLFNSCGAAAGQTVFHFHIHVLPRYAGDGLRLPWTPAPADQDELQAAAAALRG